MRKFVFTALILIMCLAALASDVVIDGSEEVNIKVKGIKGEPGEKGDQGIPGIPGPQGPQGPPGTGSGSSYVYNPRDFGAKGDGKADDTEAFEKCKNAVPQDGTMFIPDGRYLISKTLVIKRRINIVGQGFGSQICMVGDDTLFHFDGTGFECGLHRCNVSDLHLGSYAQSEGKALLFYDKVGYSNINRVAMCGSYYGLYCKGSLMITTHDLCGHWGYPMFFRQVPLNKECYYFAERAYGLAVNNHRHHDLYIQGGNGGIKVRNSNAEGGIYLSGLIEGMRKFSVDVAGITMYFIVDGLWCEALCSDVYLTSVAGASIRGLYTSGSMVLRGCLSPKIVGGYLKDIDVDESCSDVKISGTRVTSMSKFKPATAEPFGVINASDVYKGASGQFVRPGWNFPDSLCDHTLQSWENGLPKGFTAPLTKVSKADITFQGRQAAKIEIDRLMSYTGLRYQLKKRDFAGRRSALTISAWVYKPSQGGMNPRIYLIYGGQGSTGEAFSIEPDKWTPITVTIYPKPDLTVDPAVLWGTYATSASQTGIFYIAMPTIGM